MRPATRALGLLLLAMLPLLTTGCAVGHYYGAQSGRVVDKETGKPLEGASVVALYSVGIASPGGTSSETVDAQETAADGKGEFTIPGKFVFSPQFGLGWFASDPEIVVSMVGYGQFGRHVLAERRRGPDGAAEYRLPQLRDPKERDRNAVWDLWPFGKGSKDGRKEVEQEVREHQEKLRYFLKMYNKERAALGYPPI